MSTKATQKTLFAIIAASGLTLVGCQSTAPQNEAADPVAPIPEETATTAVAPAPAAEVSSAEQAPVAVPLAPAAEFSTEPSEMATADQPDESLSDEWAAAEYDPDTVWDEADRDAGDFEQPAADLASVSGESLALAAQEFVFQVDETTGLAIEEGSDREPEAATTITISAPAPDSVVSIDGIVAGSAGDEISVPPGAVTVTVSAPGYRPKEVNFDAQAGQNTAFDVELDPMAATVAN